MSLWILFSFLAPLAWAIGNVGDKYIFSKWIKEPIVALMAFGIVGVLAAAIVYIFKGFGGISQFQVLIALISGLVYFFANFLYYSAVQAEDVSRVISLIYLDPFFTAVCSAILLGEIFSPIQYLGIVMLVAAALLVSYKKSVRNVSKKGIWLAIISAVFYGANNILTKHLVDGADLWTVFAVIRLGTFLGVLPLFYFKRRAFLNLVKTGRGFIATMANNSMSMLGVLLFSFALSLGYVTLTTSLSAVQPFFVFLITLILGAFWPHILKEEGGKWVVFQKFFAIA